MPDELKPAETKPAVADPAKNDTTNEIKFDDKGEGVKQPQTKEENAAFAAERRARERAEAVKEAETNAILLATDGVNPYTQKPMKTAYDVDEYKTMKKLAKEGKDPIADFHEVVKAEAKHKDDEQNARQQSEEAAKKDIADFKTKHPTVDIPKLMEDVKFRTFSKYALGNAPLSQIYDDYVSLTAPQEKPKEDEKDLAKKAQAAANAAASPGSLTANPAEANAEFFTLAQIKAMSQKEVAAQYEKVQKSLRHLNVIK